MFRLIFWAILALDALFWWWADRRARRLPRPTAWRVAIALFVGVQLADLLAMFVVPGLRRDSHAWMPSWSLAVIYIWHLLVLPVWALLAGAWGLGRLVTTIGKRLSRRPTPAPLPAGIDAEASAVAPVWTRRQVLMAAAVAAPPVAAVGLTAVGVSRLSDLRIRAIDVPISGLPPALDGLRIAHVTDVHVGRYTRGAHLRRIAEATNKLEADLVLMTGDLLDQSISDLPEALEFVRMLDPRGGLFMCEGNHDLIGDGDAFRARTKAAGVPLLVQESATIDVRGEPVQLLGVTWGRGEDRVSATTTDLLGLRDPAAFPILLAHHPHCFDYAAPAGIPLTLAGHTHGGQLMINERLGAGPAMFRYWTGLYGNDAGRLVVSNGAGNWFPLRTAAPAEILNLTLRRVG